MAGLEDVYNHVPMAPDPMQSPDAMQALMARAAAAERLARGVRSPDRANTTIDETLAEFIIPQNPAELAMLALPGGAIARAGGKIGSKTLAALMGLAGAGSYASEAEAGPLAVLRKGIKAYHGSPHDFDKFDMSKIGTGEGAQAYGHGLYFAENPKVAQEYKDALASNRTQWMYGDRELSGAEQNAATILERVDGNKEHALTHIKYALRPMRLADQKHLDETVAAIHRLDPSKIKVRQEPGRMYEVNIAAAPEQFLDWDKPLAGQPQAVQDLWAQQFKGAGGGPQRLDVPVDPAAGAFVPDVTGQQLYQRLGGQSGMGGADASRWATDALKHDAGIPGIRYLDQGSRFRPDTQMLAGFGEKPSDVTHNYVMFDDSLIDILRKYGLAGASPLGALMGLGATDQAQAADNPLRLTVNPQAP